jgi:hypothetical protein
MRAWPTRADADEVTRICAIDGMAGVGKTAFAVHAAHRLASGFPDGNFFVRLHGHTPGQKPLEAADALTTLLLAAGIAPQQIPEGQDARGHVERSHSRPSGDVFPSHCRQQTGRVLRTCHTCQRARPQLTGWKLSA